VEPNTRQEDRRFYVYFLRRPDKDDPIGTGNGCPFYIGKGCNGRYLSHRWEAENLRNKSGSKSIKIIIIYKLWKQSIDFIEDIMFDNLTEQEAHELEMEAITIYGRINLGTGCLANLTNGGDGVSGLIQTDETRQKMRLAHLGEKHLEDRCRKNSELRKGNRAPWYGKSLPKEMREKISKTLTGKLIGEKNPFYGKKHSPETIKKMREVKLGKNQTEESNKKRSASLKQTWKFKKWDKIISQFLGRLF